MLSHVGGAQTFKNIGKDAGLAGLFAIGGVLTSDDGPLKDATPATKRLVNLAFGAPMLAKLELPALKETWKERGIPDFVMHGLTATVAALGAGTNDRDMITSAAMLAALFSMAGHLEEGVQSKSLAGIQKLEELVPETAHLHKTNMSVPISDVKMGHHVRVVDGGTIPVDGIVKHIEVAGEKSSLGAIQMPRALDGEGKQMAVTIGGKVPQGAIAADGTKLVVETKALAADSAISRNIQYLHEAESVPGKAAHSITGSIKNIYVPIMLAAVAAEFAWSYHKHKKKHDKQAEAQKLQKEHNLDGIDKAHWDEDKKASQKLMGAGSATGELDMSGWERGNRARTNVDHARKSVKRSTELAIKMAPCAIMASLLVIPFIKNALASSHGVMVREDAALENLKKVSHVLTDIRGTLTTGVSDFKGLHVWDSASNALKSAATEVEHSLLGLMGKAQTASTHEIATSVRKAAADAGHDLQLAAGEKVKNYITRGVSGKFADGHEIMMGGKRVFEDNGHTLPGALLKAAEERGGDVSFFRHTQGENVQYGIASFNDELRAGAKEAIQKLRKDGKEVVLVTGMPKKSAEAILKELDTHDMPNNPIHLRAECLPRGKAGNIGKDDVVKEFTKEKGLIAAIGDGENDAPFMTQVKNAGGISMAIASTGAAVTKDKASMVFEGIHQLPDLMKLSKNMSHALWLNVGAAASWMSLLVGSHYAGHHMKAQTASVLHEAPTFLLTLASLGQSLRLTGQFANLGR